MTTANVVHGGFTIERTVPASRERAFRAFSVLEEKQKWFVGPPEWTTTAHEFDFRVGGTEYERGGPPEGPEHTFICRYHDIVENERIIYTYEMEVGGERISVSVASIEFFAESDGTRVIVTEHGAFIGEGTDGPAMREEGTIGLMDQLVASLSSTPVG